jgi:hypothetical protein
MDGRAGLQPTETNGTVGSDDHSGTSASGNGNGSQPALPLTIREVVRRGRLDLEEIDRLRGEVDRLRIRAESAEHLLSARPAGVAPVATNGNGSNGNGSNGNGHDGNGSARNGKRRNGKRASASAWATAAVVPHTRES